MFSNLPSTALGHKFPVPVSRLVASAFVQFLQRLEFQHSRMF
jgi:hypothetical protein